MIDRIPENARLFSDLAVSSPPASRPRLAFLLILQQIQTALQLSGHITMIRTSVHLQILLLPPEIVLPSL